MNDNAAKAFAQARWMFAHRKVHGAAMDVALWPLHARVRYVYSDDVVEPTDVARWSQNLHYVLVKMCQMVLNILLDADPELEMFRQARACADREYMARRALLGPLVIADEQAMSANYRGLAALHLEKRRMKKLSPETRRKVNYYRKLLATLDREQVDHGELQRMLWG